MDDPHARPLPPALTRRRLLRHGALTGGGLAAALVAACAPGSRAGWTYAPGPTGGVPSGGLPAAPSTAAAAAATSTPMDHASAPPSGMADHDRAAEAVVKRFPEKTDRVGNQPLAPRLEDGRKVFELETSAFDWQIDAQKPPVQAVGYNGTWPGPVLRVVEGDRVRVIVTNRLDETTGVHFHGQSLPNAMDGVPFVTQPPIPPGGSFSYEFTARPAGSHMYHSHHNATDQVGRGLLGAFLVDPKDPAQRPDRLYGVSQDIVWISNDSLGGFTINGKGFPATAPIVARLGERILIRFMNEGVMMHPWHLHGMPMRIVARDGYPLGGAGFTCDTLGVNPGERWDAVIDCDNPGVWAFHCHVLPHAEGRDGMFGMVNALIVEP
ncbi:MAG TPA: multicopper oxidase domain-containing protein [Candidatus Limnocylindrales bacterium]|nr:multicopper oxidase domain-containing protein [Candidatus Limnocylindrales bacterium]